MATFTETTIDGALTEKRGTALTGGIITKQANLNSDVIFSCVNHGLVANQPITFTASTGTNSGGNTLLPANIIAGTVYYVRPGWSGGAQHILTGVANNFQVSTTPGGTEILWGSGFQGSVASPGHTFSPSVTPNPIAAQSTAAIDNIVKTAGTGEYSKTATSYSFYATVAYDSNLNRILVSAGNNEANFWVGTPSADGESITFGAYVNWQPEYTDWIASSYDITQERILLVTYDSEFGSYIARVINIAGAHPYTMGTRTTWMSSVNTNGNFVSPESMAYDANRQKHVLIYNHGGGGLRAVVGTVVGSSTNSIDWNTPATNYFQVSSNNGCGWPSIVYHAAAQKVVAIYVGSGAIGYARVGTVAANGTITFGTEVAFAGDVQDCNLSISYDTILQKVVLCYNNLDITNFARVIIGTVTGTDINFGASYNSASGPSVQVAPTTSPVRTTEEVSIIYDANVQKHIVYYKTATSGDTTLKLYAKAATISASTLSCVKNGTTTVTTASTSTLAQYMVVSGTGIPVGAIIASITNSTTFVLSSAATDSLTSTLTFTRITVGAEKLIETPDTGKSFTSSGPYNLASAYMSNSSVKKTIAFRAGGTNTNSIGGSTATLTHLNHSILTVDLALGNFFELDLEYAEGPIGTFTINNAPAAHESSFILKITQGSTAHPTAKSTDTQDLFDWSLLTAFKWNAGTVPTLTTTNNAVDILSFTTYDNGTTWHGSVVGQNFS